MIKKAIVPILLAIVTFLAFKFIMWNSWKWDRAISMAKTVIKAEPAVNLSLFLNGKPIFHKSFPHNTSGNYYLINQFDISPYVGALAVQVNRGPLISPRVYPFKTFFIAQAGPHYFIFTTPQCDIEEFVRIKTFLPVAADYFASLVYAMSALK